MIGKLKMLLNREAGSTLVRLAGKAGAEGDNAAAELLISLAYVAFDIQYEDLPDLDLHTTPDDDVLAYPTQLSAPVAAPLHPAC
ncbi:MAG: hypothetical protein JOY71_31910 [Acetobacteraceae bacterium]|nr:hypothetical protein [Acetobacteraceae bacterium]MBV8526669.1 hypothetical protein [Acetobacteraceae bacterium]